MTGEVGGGPGPVRPAVATAFATIGFVALLIFGFGMASLALDEDVIATPGLGLLPGAVAVATATLGFLAALAVGLRAPQPGYGVSLWCAAAAFLGYLAGLWLVAVITGAGVGAATGAVGGFVTSWFGAVLIGVALVCGWSGVALVRTRASRPRWPWEDDGAE